MCCRADRITGYVGTGRAESVRAAVLFEKLLRSKLKCAAHSWLQRSGNNRSAHMSLVVSWMQFACCSEIMQPLSRYDVCRSVAHQHIAQDFKMMPQTARLAYSPQFALVLLCRTVPKLPSHPCVPVSCVSPAAG